MDKVAITVMGYRCLRCEHEWVPKVKTQPRVCPQCKSAWWDVPRDKSKKTKQTVA